MEVPACFKRLCGASLRSKQGWPNLANHDFSPDEKKFLVDEILGIHNFLEETNHWHGVSTRTEDGMSRRYNIPRRTLRGWVDKVDTSDSEDEQVFQTRRGGQVTSMNRLLRKSRTCCTNVAGHADP